MYYQKYVVYAVTIILFILHANTSFSQTSEEIKAIRDDVKALKESNKEIQRDLQEIKNILTRKPAREVPARRQVQKEFTETLITIEGAPYKGDKDAKLTLIEFSDYQCPFCSRHVRDTVPYIEKEFVETGKIRYIFLNFPLKSHQQAFKAAEAAECAGEQGEFWQMHDRLFANQKALNPEDILGYAKEVGLDLTQFQACFDSEKYTDEINKDISEGQKAGITGTPTVLLGWIESDGKEVKAVEMIKGAQPLAAYKDAINKLLNTQKDLPVSDHPDI